MMSVLLTYVCLLFAGGESGFMRFYHDYLDVPGFEAWKFLNLAVFLAVIIYIVRRPLSDAFKARREEIRAELIKAEQEKQAALSRLNEIESKIARLETEREEILKNAKDEAANEKKRLAAQTKAEIERLKQQAQSELARFANQSRAELRRFSAEESIRLAEEKLRKQIDVGKDTKLVKAGINEIGGLN
jgi:F0F1-type ATP synthase membrane subunit b/b'